MKIHTAFLLPALLAPVLYAEAPQPSPPKPAAPDAPAAPAPTDRIEVGSKVTLDAVKAATWLQGKPPESFEPGHVYIFEAWATWCGPCVRVIPHMNALHKKYHDKGLRVYGMNVFEDGQEKVAEFVKNKGEEMSYPVAYTGKTSRFDKEWMKAAGVRGIPHSFVVMDGIIVMRTHPSTLSDELIEKLLKGGDEARKAIESHSKGSAAKKTITRPDAPFREAAAKGDIATMERILAEKEKQDPKSPAIRQMKVELLFAKKQWQEIDAALVSSPKSIEEGAMANLIANQLAMGKENSAGAPKELRSKAATQLATRLNGNPRSNPMEWVTLSRLQFAAGEQEQAKASAQTAMEKAKSVPQGQGMPATAFEKFSTEVQAGRLPRTEDFSGWIIESIQKR